MSPQDELVDAQLKLLLQMNLATAKPEDRQEWLDNISDMRAQYGAARQIEDDTSKTAAQRAYAKEVGDSIAKGLPVITKGVTSAISAFSKGDNITGSAAIMDICAAAAPIMSAIFGAAGPEGMLVGALFSVVGQILAFFGPKQPSVVDQIKELLQALNTEQQLQDMGAVRLSIEEYYKNLTSAYRQLAQSTGTALVVRPGEKAQFDESTTKLTGKKIVVAGTMAVSDAKTRTPTARSSPSTRSPRANRTLWSTSSRR
jgi:hypothetical protein